MTARNKLTWTLEDNAGKSADPHHHRQALTNFLCPEQKVKHTAMVNFHFLSVEHLNTTLKKHQGSHLGPYVSHWITVSPKPLEQLKLFYAAYFWQPLLHQKNTFSIREIIRKSSLQRVCLDWMATKIFLIALSWLDDLYLTIYVSLCKPFIHLLYTEFYIIENNLCVVVVSLYQSSPKSQSLIQ